MTAPMFTPREVQVLEAIAHGHRDKGIARALDMGLSTVATHKTHIREKAAIERGSRAALARFALAWVEDRRTRSAEGSQP